MKWIKASCIFIISCSIIVTVVLATTPSNLVVHYQINNTGGGGHIVVQNDTGAAGNTSHDNTTSADHGKELPHKAHGIHVVSINYTAVKFPLILSVVILLAALSKIGFHHADFLSSIIPESCLLIVIGTVLGAIVYHGGLDDTIGSFFTPSNFFMFLLPPIILEAAFSLHDRTFTDNLGSVLIFAVIGTLLSCFFIGLTLFGLKEAGAMGGGLEKLDFVQVLLFSALIVAVDPVAVLAVFQEIGVNHVLYFLVFGESLLNDGVTIVLYTVMQTYNELDVITGDQIVLGFVKFIVVVFGGLLIGIFFGALSAFITKYTKSVKVTEPIAIFCLAYLGFLMAELFHFSGIISIIGCGLVQVEYAFHNISHKSKTTVKYFTKVISTTNEIMIFLFLGLKLIGQSHVWHTGFVLWTVFFCLVYRFLITFFLSFLINRLDSYRVRKISLDEQFMMAYGGLRGAVCFSLVVLLNEDTVPMKEMFVTTTLVVILFTVMVQGITIKPFVKFFRVRLAGKDEISLFEELNQHVSDHIMAGVEDIVGIHGKFYLREIISHYDAKYIRPLLQRDIGITECDIANVYEKLVIKEHFRNLYLCGAKTSLPAGVSLAHSDTQAMLTKMATITEDDSVFEQSDTRPRVKLRKHLTEKQAEPTPRNLRNMITSTPSLHLLLRNNFDKDMVKGDRLNFLHQINRKRFKNQQLSTMQSPLSRINSIEERQLERTMSLPEQETEACKIRGHAKAAAEQSIPLRAFSMDAAPPPEDAVDSFAVPSTVTWNLDETDRPLVKENGPEESDPLLHMRKLLRNNFDKDMVKGDRLNFLHQINRKRFKNQQLSTMQSPLSRINSIEERQLERTMSLPEQETEACKIRGHAKAAAEQSIPLRAFSMDAAPPPEDAVDSFAVPSTVTWNLDETDRPLVKENGPEESDPLLHMRKVSSGKSLKHQDAVDK